MQKRCAEEREQRGRREHPRRPVRGLGGRAVTDDRRGNRLRPRDDRRTADASRSSGRRGGRAGRRRRAGPAKRPQAARSRARRCRPHVSLCARRPRPPALRRGPRPRQLLGGDGDGSAPRRPCGRAQSRRHRGGRLTVGVSRRLALRMRIAGRRGRGGGRGRRRRDRRGRRCGNRRTRRLPFRQQRQRVHVALGVVGHSDSEVDIRDLHLGGAGGADRTHGLTLGDTVPRTHRDRAQMEQRDGIAVRGPDRQGLPVGRQRPGERDPT
jgi:hypothetical protein